MESWTVINTWEKPEEGKTLYETSNYKLNKPEQYWKSGLEEDKSEIIICQKEGGIQYENKPEYHKLGEYKPTYEWNKPTYEWNKPTSEWNKPTSEWNKPEYHKHGEYKPTYEWNKPEYHKHGETKPTYEWNKPVHQREGEYKSTLESWKHSEYKPSYELNKPEYYSRHGEHKMPYYGVEKVCGDWERICEKIERVHVEEPRWNEKRSHYECGRIGGEMRPRWSCKGQGCCDEEMIKQIKNLITIFVGAEQSYEQLGFLCMDERFTLVNTSEYFRLCGLRMRWLANGLIRRSNRLFNVNEWINNTTFNNWFKVPTKEELSTNDYTGIMKTLFKITMDSEKHLVEVMEVLVEKMMKSDSMNTECRFDGFKWFINFVLPCQIRFLREVTKYWQSIHMCNNGYVFDKVEMRPLVQKIEEFLQYIVKNNEKTPNFLQWQGRHF